MVCSKCGENKEETEFHSRGNGKLHKQCKFCKRIAIKKHYEENKQQYIERAKDKNKEIRSQIQDLLDDLKSVPCFDCKKNFPPYCMDFDHVDGKKLANVSDLKKFTSIKNILIEVKKCEVVCAICHRIRTHNRLK